MENDEKMEQSQKSGMSEGGSPGQEPSEPKADLEKDQRIEVNFVDYITSLSYQAMIFLGEVVNPLTNKIEPNLKQAQLLIDTIAMLKDKTAGNLDEREDNYLTVTLYELRMRYIEKSKAQGETA